MRALSSSLVALGLATALAVGCDGDLEGDRVPMCTDTFGCPEGTRCVNGQTCVAEDGAEPPVEPPVQPSEVPSPPTTSPDVPRARPPVGQDGAGAPLLDAGDLGPLDGGLLPCEPGLVACETGCVDVTSDRRNCGGCGLDCGPAGECIAGLCARELGPELPPGNPPFGF